MGALELLAGGFSVAIQPLNLMLAFGGVFVGTVVGMLPGVGPINAISILIPLIFAVDIPPQSALILLAGIYYGSQYGNSISTILLNVPGTASAVVTALDGYPMAKQGRAAEALASSAIASFVGGTLSVFGLVLFAPPLAKWAIKFGPAEYFALMVFAFVALSGMAGKHGGKALVAVGIGLFLASVGVDPNSAVPRFTFGQLRLLDGMDFVVVVIGLFAVSEVLIGLETTGFGHYIHSEVGKVSQAVKKLKNTVGSMLRGSAIGFFTGVLPGAGGTVASFLAYSAEQKVLGEKGNLGEGDVRGVAAPEASNNAAATGAMIPLLTLGVPGSGTTAVMLGALIGLNVTPGPLMMEQRPEIFWGLAASMYIGNCFLLILNLPLVGLFVKILSVPRWLLMSAIAGFSFVAVYSVNNSTFDLVLMTGIGFLGYGLRKLEIPLAPIVLALVLGPIMEKNLRRALLLSAGDWHVLFSGWLAIALWLVTVLLVIVSLIWRLRAAVK
ncbi:MAG: tripartite tricarboxylate transporter permease [Gemmatimonadota bacterium]|nr:tripartite tricarboxylate transporter permease [Gemmatimonadota bacterium]